MCINRTHTEKSPHGDQHLISNDNVTAKWSLKVMRILEQCDYRPKVQWAITPFIGWVGWWCWWWWWGLWLWGGTCRRGIVNIIFHSSEANLFLNNMFCQVIFDLVSNQDSFWCSFCVIMLGPCWRRTLGLSSSPQETNVCHWQWWQECKVMEHVWRDVTSTNRLGSKGSFFRL